LTVAEPLAGEELTWIAVTVPPPVSLEATAIVTGVLKAVEATSGDATGAALIPLIVIVTTVVEEPPRPSLIV
jgi:hypothetical protein